jgi:membrane protease YdiL (CAAX protease family)
VACAIGAVLVLPFEIERERRIEDPESTIAWDSSQSAFLITYKDDDRPRMLWGLAEVVAVVAMDMRWSLLAIVAGLGLGPSVGLSWPPLAVRGEDPRRLRRVGSTLLLAVALGATSVILQFAAAVPLLLAGEAGPNGDQTAVPPWYLALPASFGAAIREEVWLRLGFMTTVVWVIARVTRRRSPGAATLWSGIVLAGLLFAALHLPLVVGRPGDSWALRASVLLGGTALGVVFGWLYWRKGLVAAMAAHATQDVITKVLIPLLGL